MHNTIDKRYLNAATCQAEAQIRGAVQGDCHGAKGLTRARFEQVFDQTDRDFLPFLREVMVRAGGFGSHRAPEAALLAAIGEFAREADQAFAGDRVVEARKALELGFENLYRYAEQLETTGRKQAGA